MNKKKKEKDFCICVRAGDDRLGLQSLKPLQYIHVAGPWKIYSKPCVYDAEKGIGISFILHPTYKNTWYTYNMQMHLISSTRILYVDILLFHFCSSALVYMEICVCGFMERRLLVGF